MIRTQEVQPAQKTVFYLPHHGVLREHSLTTKLRVVFNGSSRTTSGQSLNDLLHTGVNLQVDIFNVLLRIRLPRIIFSTDVKMMFRQIKVHPADHDLQRILWVDEQNNIIPYKLTTVTYGTRSAPFLAVRVLLQLVQDEGKNYPLAIGPLTKGRYVDDIYGGSDSLQETQRIAQDLINICKAGNFPLAKWASNSFQLLQALSQHDVSTPQAREMDDTQCKVFGLSWNPSTDQFQFSPKRSTVKKFTKRSVLSEVAQLFDPLGFLAPVTICSKLFMQELWLIKSGWDDELPDQLAQRLIRLRDNLADIAQIRIPRWLETSPDSQVQLHGFSDASQLAMAACVYIRVTNSDESTHVALICASTKVAPLKPMTIPRLELTAALILSKLVKSVQEVLEYHSVPVFLWTDSSVALTWIQSHPSRWKEFVRNKVTAIQELIPNAQWRFVPGKQNPADCASRGLAPSKLNKFKLWWKGPQWLECSTNSWPVNQFQYPNTAAQEERPGVLLHTLKAPDERAQPFWDLLSRYSSALKLFRVTAQCLRVLLFRKNAQRALLGTPLTQDEVESARITWIKLIQQTHFATELRALQQGSNLPSAHFISRLTAFIDCQGVLRLGGRLKHAQLDPEAKHPIMLPRSSQFSLLVIAQAHLQTLHGGTQSTLAQLRRNYWILGGRAPVRSYILKCVICARYRAKRAEQLMGQIPEDRLAPTRPFNITGVDYAGPFSLKTFNGRGAKTYKCWISVFVCFVTSALHREVVTDYSADAFVKAFRRFISRRGICSKLYSDCGTTFQGANTFLKKLFSRGSTDNTQLTRTLAQEGTEWIFNPPSAPHFGGKWEAAVKSVKFHLHRTIGESLFSYEDFTTLLAQIEAVLNSRPISPLSDDPEDLNALTPAHFLVGSALITIPEPQLADLPASRLAIYQLIQQKLQHFWKRWSAECLQRYQGISKWHHPSHIIKVGSLVLLSDERTSPAVWPHARVTALHPGSDGLVRVVSIKTATTTFTRPIAKLIVLPIENPVTFRNAVPEGGEDVQEGCTPLTK